MTKLSVNINKVATIRNARGNNVPNLLKVALDIEKFGADGITVHPRPDERHIRYADVSELAQNIQTEFNVEGYPNKRFMDLVLSTKPHQVTLVPDPPGVLTSNAGWKVKENKSLLEESLGELSKAGIRTSVFMEANTKDIEQLALIQVDRAELYTESYASGYSSDKEEAIRPFMEAAKLTSEMGIGLNAGHDLNVENLAFFASSIHNLLEVSIGHALVADALYFGFEKTIAMYKNLLK